MAGECGGAAGGGVCGVGGYGYGGAAGGYAGYAGGGGYGGGYGGGGGGGLVAPGPGGPPVVFPLPDSGAYAVGVSSDGSLQVVRYGPVWTNEVGPNGWAHRHYIHYGFPFSGIWPFN